MSNSKAFKNFIDSLQMTEELLDLERKCKNPPLKSEEKIVQALRGSASVLMVASFEYFLREMVEEHLTCLVSNTHQISFDQLPEKMQICTIFNSLEQAMKGKPFEQTGRRVDRIPAIQQACSSIVAQVVNPAAFSNTGSNPNSNTVDSIFKNVGINNVLSNNNNLFERKWGKPIAQRFIIDKLDEIINRRHIVAHTADALNITRSDLREAVKFLKTLAELLDIKLYNHIQDILQQL